ncbi:hypothetical protein D3C85_1256920 [compost metagenome]
MKVGKPWLSLMTLKACNRSTSIVPPGMETMMMSGITLFTGRAFLMTLVWPRWCPRGCVVTGTWISFGGSSSRNSQATQSVGSSSGMILVRSSTLLNRVGSTLRISLSRRRTTALTLSTFGSLGQRHLKGAQLTPRELSLWLVRS